MKNAMFGVALAMFAVVACNTAPKTAADKQAQGSEVESTVAKFEASNEAVGTYMKTAQGYAVFPSVGKGGIGVGGAFGRGQVFAGGKMVGYSKLTAASIGFQLGGQKFSEIIFFETEGALTRFKTGEFGFDANASAVAVTAGAAAKADYKNGVAVFVSADGGLMYEASIGGQKFDFEPAK
jgi:lipid-binding SYLF domain-containing protein